MIRIGNRICYQRKESRKRKLSSTGRIIILLKFSPTVPDDLENIDGTQVCLTLRSTESRDNIQREKYKYKYNKYNKKEKIKVHWVGVRGKRLIRACPTDDHQ